MKLKRQHRIIILAFLKPINFDAGWIASIFKADENNSLYEDFKNTLNGKNDATIFQTIGVNKFAANVFIETMLKKNNSGLKPAEYQKTLNVSLWNKFHDSKNMIIPLLLDIYSRYSDDSNLTAPTPTENNEFPFFYFCFLSNLFRNHNKVPIIKKILDFDPIPKKIISLFCRLIDALPLQEDETNEELVYQAAIAYLLSEYDCSKLAHEQLVKDTIKNLVKKTLSKNHEKNKAAVLSILIKPLIALNLQDEITSIIDFAEKCGNDNDQKKKKLGLGLLISFAQNDNNLEKITLLIINILKDHKKLNQKLFELTLGSIYLLTEKNKALPIASLNQAFSIISKIYFETEDTDIETSCSGTLIMLFEQKIGVQEATDVAMKIIKNHASETDIAIERAVFLLVLLFSEGHALTEAEEAINILGDQHPESIRLRQMIDKYNQPIEDLKTLGLPANTPKGDPSIKKAYRTLAMRWHPDKNPGN